MAREQEQWVRVTCDGCGASAKCPPAPLDRWRSVRVSASLLEDGVLVREVELELCPTCLGRVQVPGLEAKLTAELEGAV